MHRAVFIALALAATLSLPGNAGAIPADLQEQVDRLFEPFDSRESGGCAVGVIQDGQYLLKRAYGMASLEHDIPLSSASVFRIGSVSKQFTAMAILLLEEQGKLDLDADVHDYLPELVDYGHRVTLRQMLHHTAGMADYGDSPELFPNALGGAFRWGNEDYLSTAEFYDRVRQVPLLHPPGTRYLYSNFAYFLLGQVVDRVSGMSMRQFAEEHIFQPLGMGQTLFNDDVNRVIKQHAYGYRKRDDGQVELYMTNLPWVGDGGIYTSIDDFIQWDRNFYQNRLGRGGPALIESMQAPGQGTRVEEDGETSEYAMALRVSARQGHRRIGHSGSWVAFTSSYGRYPDLGLSVVTLCNTGEASAPSLAQQVEDIVLATASPASRVAETGPRADP